MNDRLSPNQVEVFEPTPRWVRAELGGVAVASSRRTMLLRPAGGLPVYYFPAADVRQDLLTPTGRTLTDARYGAAALYTVAVGERSAEDAAWAFTAPPADGPALGGYFAFAWKAMDAWYEEAEQIYVHARDPYKRVDVCAGARHIEVVVNGVKVADSRRPQLLFETGLPTRYYLPLEDVRQDLLRPSDTHTQCPYKGEASYYSVQVGDDQVARDIVWYYPAPIAECPRIAGLLSFYNEKVDIYVDGELEPKPHTRWS